MPKSTRNMLISGYSCIVCGGAFPGAGSPHAGGVANRYSFACIFCALLFGVFTVLSCHTRRDFRLWQGLALMLGGSSGLSFPFGLPLSGFPPFFGALMALCGAGLSFIRGSFAGYLGLVHSTVCALMLVMSGMGLYLSRESAFSELTYLIQSFWPLAPSLSAASSPFWNPAAKKLSCSKAACSTCKMRIHEAVQSWTHGYLNCYNNRRTKAKLKGLPPVIHRQRALLAA